MKKTLSKAQAEHRYVHKIYRCPCIIRRSSTKSNWWFKWIHLTWWYRWYRWYSEHNDLNCIKWGNGRSGLLPEQSGSRNSSQSCRQVWEIVATLLQLAACEGGEIGRERWAVTHNQNFFVCMTTFRKSSPLVQLTGRLWILLPQLKALATIYIPYSYHTGWLQYNCWTYTITC